MDVVCRPPSRLPTPLRNSLMSCLRLPLSGKFEFQHPETSLWHPAVVPGCIHTDLLRAGLIPDPFFGTNERDLQWIERRDWRYRGHFSVPPELLAHQKLELVFEGLDTLAEISLNGIGLGRTENMFTRHVFEIRRCIQPADNLLEITFRNTLDYLAAHAAWQPVKERNDPVGGRSRIRKEQCQYSWDWGPRFVTCGIWREVFLEGWTEAKIEHLHVAQDHRADGEITVRVKPRLSGATGTEELRAELFLDNMLVAAGAASGELALTVSDPQRWWPSGQGHQPLYELRVELISAKGHVLDRSRRRLGLRKIELVRDKDREGESFYFRVNGRPIFAKGANWIPDHAFVTECNRTRYLERLQAATDAHMNMIRVWGGGIYEGDTFYDVCDELGLLVWQDFMFACALYPGADEYCAILRPEAEQQVERLHDRACLALWCGNNEIPMIPELFDELRGHPLHGANYARVFHDLLPEVVARCDGTTPYWPSSPWTAPELFGDANASFAGDVHYWKVWHARAPVKSYETLRLRFCSEFGMQSYPSATTAATFCPPAERNVFSPVMESHQKNGGGNATMLHYISQRFRYASGYENLAYLSQLSQAHCMKVGVEHFRWMMPYTMGALYWQLNDCWPVASWSSIEFNGHWKALHHEARRFFAPSLLHLRTDGDVMIGRYNEITQGIDRYQLCVVHDAPDARSALLVWSLRDFSGEVLSPEEQRPITLEPRQPKSHGEVCLPESLRGNRRGQVYLRAELRTDSGEVLSRQNAFFTLPRFLALEDPKLRVSSHVRSDTEWEIELTAASFAPAVELSFGKASPRLSDNWFDLHAGETRRITARCSPSEPSPSECIARLSVRSLWHSYQE